MAPPPSSIAPAVHPVLREVTEDTPPDLLEGTMDLLVVLPSKKTVRMTVSRRTPMMDLLIQAATSNKIVPGGHIVQVRNERGFELPYKPSTPIGALDTTTIEIVPKNQVNEYIIVKKQTAKIANQPFEHTFRLQVHLPRNQLYVMRAGPKTLLSDILQEVCQEKNLDYAKYEMRHPVKLDEKLPLDRRLGDFGLQEVTVVSRNSRINSSVSTADIMALQNQNEASRSKGGLDSAFKHSRSSVGDSSVSSESAASARGISPSRSDDSRSISPLPPIRPKLKLNTTMSNASSSSGTSSALPKSTLQNSTIIPNNNNNYPNSVGRTSTSLITNNIIQAPPRTKKRAAPQPPTATPTLVPNSNNSNHHTHGSNNNMNHNVNVQTKNGVNVSLPPQSPLNNNANSNGTNNDQTTVVTTVAPTPPIRPTPRKKDPPKEPPGIAVAVPVPKIITTATSNTTTTLPPPAIHHSRQSSDSSGYHEACVMCDNQETHVHHQSHRFDRQQSVPSIINSLHSSNQRMTSSVSVSNLTTVPSISSTSLASSNGGIRNKRKAPKPPVAPICILQAQKEIDEDISASLTKTSSSSTNFSNSSTSTTRVSRSNSESSSSIISQADPQPNSAPAPLQKITATTTNNKSEVPPPLTTTATTTTTTSSKYRYRQLSVEEVEVEVEVHEESPVRRISVDLSEEQDEDNNIIATSLPGSFDSTVSSNSSPTSELSHASTTSSPLPTPSATLIVDEGQTQDKGESQKQDKTENKNNEPVSPNKAEVAVPVSTPVLNLEPEPATTNKEEKAETIESSQVGLHTDYASVEVSRSEPQASNNTIPSIDVPVEKMSRPVSASPVAPSSVEDRDRALPNAQADLNSSAQAPEPPRPRRPRSTAATPLLSSPQDPPPPTASTPSESGPPKPKPRPRSAGPPVNSRSVPTPNSGTGPTLSNNKNSPESAPVPVSVVASPNRITGMGIKVFPDDALAARIARLSQQEREELHESLPQKSKTELELAHQKSLERASPVRRSRSKARAPAPTATTLNAPTPRSTVPSGDFPTTDSSKTKSAHQNYSASSQKNTTGIITPIQDWNQQSRLERDRRGDEPQSADSGTSSDSDNLEENLELFELGKKPKKRMAPPVPSNVSVNTTPSTKSNNNTNISQSTGTGPVPVPHTLTRRSNGPIKSAEDVYENEAITSPSHNGMMGMSSKSKNKNEDNVFLSRTSSDRRHFTKNPSETSKSLNRWQNFESLDHIEQSRQQKEKQTPKLQHRLIKVTNSNNSTASSSSSGDGGGELSLTTINTARKKISVSSDLLLTANDLDNNTGDHREIQDDTVHLSSESEISYADSGVPATETITPSPIDVDLGRSDKGISSGGSSRRSSVHSIDGTDNETKDNLRKILRAKIQKEQEIIDKAFEGIETAADAAPESQHHDDEDDDDGLTLDSERQNSNHNSNFDFAQPASMANLLSTSATSSPHPATDQTSDDDEREDDDEGDTSSNDDEEKELKFSSGDDSTTLAAHHTSLEKSSITGNVSNNSGSSSRKTGLGKSESFSHKSEFDAVKMKRRMFSKEGKGSAVVRKSYVSSSDEDLVHAGRGGKIIGRGGGGSMQNLSSVPNNNSSHNKNGGNNTNMNNNSKNLGHGSSVNVSSVNSNRRKSTPPTKAASVVNMQEIDPDIAQNPALMESFKNELEAQFEQWKEQFMQKHLGGSKSGSLDNGSSSTSDSRKSSTVDQVDGTVLRSTSSDTPNKSPVEIEDTTDKKNDKSVDLKTIDSSSETSTATIIEGAYDADETSRVITTTVSGTSSLTTTSVKKSEEKIQKTVYVEKSLEVLQDTKESRSVENLSKGTNENAQNRNDEHQIDDSFDPEKPQIIHSVKSTSQTSTTTTTTTATNQEEETYCEPEIISQTQVFTETVAVPAKADSVTPTIVQATPKEESSLDEETSMPASKVFESQSDEMEPPVQRREKPVEEQPRIYRYTGPPTISMGTWGERPQRSVSVKRDRDYIMGMGTHDPKTTEVKPAIGSVATRIHSFLGNPVVTPVQSNHVVNSARPKSFYGVVAEATAVHNINNNNHYSNSANTSSSNSASNSNNSTMDRKVVASWKQRLEETEKERRSFQIKTPQSSIDIFEPQKEESRTSTQEPPSAPIVVSTKSNFNGNSNERPVVKKLLPSVSVESINNQQNNQSSPPPLKISTSTYGETRKIHPLTNSFEGRDIILNSNSSLNNSVSNKALSEDNTDSASDYSGSSNSRPTSSLSRAPSNASNNSNIVIASMTSSDTTTNSSFPAPASVSAPAPVSGLAEKKKFFQGIKPAESSAKETPIPAQNLKSNIATIQKVFQQRQQQQQQQQLPGQYQHQPSSLKFNGHGSSTGSSSPWTSKESSPAPSLVLNNNINNGSVGTNSNANNSTSFSGPSSSTMMVQKVMKAGSFNVEAFRRTPSPSASSLSSMSTSSKSEDRETPSPVASNNAAEAPAPSRATSTSTTPSTNRFSIGSFETRSQPKPVSVSDPSPVAAEDKKMGSSNNGTTIKNMGNKSIIIVGNNNDGTTVSGNTSVSNNIFRQQLKVSTPVPAPTSQIQTTRNPPLKVNLNGAYTSNQNQSQSQNQRSLTSTPAGLITIQSSQQSLPDIPVTTNKVSSIAANLKSNNSGFFSSLQRQPPRANSVDTSTPKTIEIQTQQQAKNVRENDKPVIIEQLEKNRKISSNNSAPFNVNKLAGNNYGNFKIINNNNNRNSNNVAKVEITRQMSVPSINTSATTASTATGPAGNDPPPPPPMINIKDGVKLRPVSLGGERPKSLSMSSSSLNNSSRSNSVTSPTSPNGNADPRSNIMEAIKNSNGKFGLRKTGSSILLN